MRPSRRCSTPSGPGTPPPPSRSRSRADKGESDRRAHKRTISAGDLPQELPSGIRIEKRIKDEESAFAIHQFLHGMAEPYKEVITLRLFGKSANWARVTFYRAKLSNLLNGTPFF